MKVLRAMLWLALVMLLTPLGGCGWIFVNGPPDDRANAPDYACTLSMTPPILDVIWGGLMVVGAAKALTASDEDWNTHYYPNRDVSLAVYVGWGAVSGFAASSGFRKVNACRAALQERGERVNMEASKPAHQDWHPPLMRSTVQQVALAPSPEVRPAGSSR